MAKEKGNDLVIGKVIVAMKGHPGTGKSTLASAVAAALKIPLIDKDDIRDSTFSLQHPPRAASAAAASHSLLNDMSYEAVCRIAATQLRLGLSVVVDSPLSSRRRLDQLIEVASAAGAGMVVVECKPSDEAEWRRRIETRGSSHDASWHKPSTWQDIERLLEGYGGCTEYDVGDISKMTVDTTGYAGSEELLSSVIEFILSNTSASPY